MLRIDGCAACPHDLEIEANPHLMPEGYVGRRFKPLRLDQRRCRCPTAQTATDLVRCKARGMQQQYAPMGDGCSTKMGLKKSKWKALQKVTLLARLKGEQPGTTRRAQHGVLHIVPLHALALQTEEQMAYLVLRTTPAER
mmetsp:Transcript_20546/g.34240  ORF Transcript_20546/g.34240 Transcript_20546/m.34240 type:complete len:140 (+) Transcript_20546:1974-2393(+)